MRHHVAFNGDADGLCALQQLRLAGHSVDALITGVKRDIELVSRVKADKGDLLTVLDVSLDKNHRAVNALLDAGVSVRYFDHHYAGDLPESSAFESYIDESADVCTSILVDRYIAGRFRPWAIVAAFGDNLPKVGEAMAHASALDYESMAILRTLGTYLNYNAYGETVDDLHFDPADLAASLLPYANPLDFVRESSAYHKLSAGYEEDIGRARALKPARAVSGAAIFVLPDASWAKRVIGVYANELLRTTPENSLAILSPHADGGYVVSVRVPANRELGADTFCRRYETGGGRKLAAGINHLPYADTEKFMADFEAAFIATRLATSE